MKLNKIKMAIMALAVSAVANAASIDYLINNSASYFQNPSQTGKITVEGVFYNPAGTVFLEDGQYINANLQNSLIEQSMTLDGTKYGSKKYSGSPSFNYLYKKNNYSIFANASTIAGGATLEYKNGIAGIPLAVESINNTINRQVSAMSVIPMYSQVFAMTGNTLDAKIKNSNFTGQNRYFQLAVGGAYKVTDKLSLSGGLKYVTAHRKLKGNVSFTYNEKLGKTLGVIPGNLEIDAKREGDGVGATFGLDYKATDTLNFALKYDTPVKLNFKTKTSETKGLSILGSRVGLSNIYAVYANGYSGRRDLPGVLSLGLSKDINKVTISGGYVHYFNDAAVMDGVEYKDGQEFNVGLDYRFSPKWTFHTGFNYAKTGAKNNTFGDGEYAINSQIYATGLTYKPSDAHEWKFGLAHVNYNEKNGVKDTRSLNGTPLSIDKSRVKYDKSINVFTLGYTYKF